MDETAIRVARLVKEEIALVVYDSRWPEMFRRERDHLRSCFPLERVKRIEHFGSTAIPGMISKPIIDILVEVTSLDATQTKIAPILEGQGYEYFWRPTWGDDTPPFYAWFIKRDDKGQRTHHIHLVEAEFEHWDRLFFRDYLREHTGTCLEYGKLKQRLAENYSRDRVAYTKEKSDFIQTVTEAAKRYYSKRQYRLDDDGV